MDRRKFLRGIAALPLVPAAIRGWAAERAEATVALAPGLNDRVLGAAIGEPAAVTVTVPPGRMIKITGAATLIRAGAGPLMLSIKEGDSTLAAEADFAGDVSQLQAAVVLAPTPGTHTYRLAWGDADISRYPIIMVERT